jgi:hypothetical protein
VITPREELLREVREFIEGNLSAADLTFQADVALAGLNLYPPDSVVDLGQAAGQLLERKPELAVSSVLQLISSDSRETRAVACVIISRLAKYNPALWAGVVRHLAADEDWEVRSFAARTYDSREGYAGAVEFHLEWVLEELSGWVRDQNYLLRHAATEALTGCVKIRPDLIPRVLTLLDPLLNDSSEYVRRGCVASLRTMGRIQPDPVLDYVAEHRAPFSDEVRESFEMVLGDSFAARHPERRAELLAKLKTN